MSKRARLADTVRDDLLDRIVSGRIAPGSLLPNEEELAASCGVSRIVIREAVKALEANGILAARAGIGTVVLPEPRWNVLDPHVLAARLTYDREGVFFEDLTTIRVALEGQMAAQAAVVATVEQREAMARSLEDAEAHLHEPDRYLDDDIRFHELITAGAQSPLGAAILALIRDPLRSSRRLSNTIPGGIEHAHASHRRIFDAIDAGDPVAASQAMTEHLAWARDELRRRRDAADSREEVRRAHR
ncbi:MULTISPECIES: FadR/GntR family transcriptional regulator [Microbacterium]|uniref:FadR/GntR family transcriptional regulator n=1 Tax=Microbacterium TaxID=33882 RepID=UPI00146E04E2|nr:MULTISPECIES: FadR/GntR family transcriptional regulator [Microbacterium]